MRALWLGAALALVLLPSNLVPGAIPLLRREWGASATELGWAVGAYLLGYAAAVLVVLPLTDRVAPLAMILAGALLTTAANLALPLLAQDASSAAALRFVAGIGLAGVYMPGVRVVAAAAHERRRGFAVGLYVSSFYLGASISFLVTGTLLEPLGWRGAALALGALAAAAIPIATLGARGVVVPLAGRARLDLSVLRSGPLVRTIAAYTGHSWELFVVRGWIAAFLTAVLAAEGRELGEATALASVWAALLLALGIPGVFVGGWLSDHLGRARTGIAVAGLSGALSLVFGALAGAPWPLVVAVGFVYGGLVGADSAVYSVSVTELAPKGLVGSAQAIQAVGGFGIGALGPVAAGLALDLGFGWIAVFAVGGAFSLLGALALLDARLIATTDPRLRGRVAEEATE